MWFFLSAISAEVWIIVVVSALVTGLIVWLLEVGAEALNADTKWMSNVMWDTVGRPVGMRDYRLSSNAANLVAFMWSFLVFIIMAMYTANLTANLTTSAIGSSIDGLADLPGKVVGTWDAFVEPLKKYNVMSTPFPWDNTEDEAFMIEQLHQGFITALVMESPVLYVHDATQCDTLLVGSVFDKVDLSAVFPPGFTDTVLLDNYNDAVIAVLATGADEVLNARFIEVPRAPCKDGDFTSSTTQHVEWGQVSGLWVMLGAAVGISLLLLAIKWVPRWVARSESWSRWLPCCVAMTQPNQRVLKARTTMLKIGSGSLSRRTPKSAQPRIPLSPEELHKDNMQWMERYAGASDGYMDGSLDAPELDDAAFQRTVVAQMARLASSVSSLQARMDGDADPTRPSQPTRYPSANVHRGEQ